MIELGFEYKVMARRKSEKSWESWTGVWRYQERMTLEEVKKFMYLRWSMKHMPENYNGCDYGIFRRMVYKKDGKITRDKYGLIKILRWSL